MAHTLLIWDVITPDGVLGASTFATMNSQHIRKRQLQIRRIDSNTQFLFDLEQIFIRFGTKFSPITIGNRVSEFAA